MTHRWVQRVLWHAIGALALAMAAPAARADGDAAWGISSNTLNDLVQSQIMARSLGALQDSVQDQNSGPGARAGRPAGDAPSALQVPGDTTTGKGIDLLASMYPREEQALRARQFSQIVVAFNKSMPTLYGVPRNNLATGMAAALVGGYAAYNNRTLPDAMVKPLVEQLQRGLQDDPRIVQATAQDKRAWYQVMVGLGMGLLVSQAELAERPDPAQQALLRRAGEQLLRSTLGVDPARLSFTTSGLQIR